MRFRFARPHSENDSRRSIPVSPPLLHIAFLLFCSLLLILPASAAIAGDCDCDEIRQEINETTRQIKIEAEARQAAWDDRVRFKQRAKEAEGRQDRAHEKMEFHYSESRRLKDKGHTIEAQKHVKKAQKWGSRKSAAAKEKREFNKKSQIKEKEYFDHQRKQGVLEQKRQSLRLQLEKCEAALLTKDCSTSQSNTEVSMGNDFGPVDGANDPCLGRSEMVVMPGSAGTSTAPAGVPVYSIPAGAGGGSFYSVPAGSAIDSAGSVVPDPCHTAQASKEPLVVNDPLFHSLNSWGQKLPDQWAIQRVGFTAPGSGKSAWDIVDGRVNSVVVAVIDTGLDDLHPDLADSNIWKNHDEIPDNDKDDDGNGYIDDVTGWNFVAHSNELWDPSGHGTQVAGIIAATTGNGLGIAGVNPGAKIMPLKVMNSLGGGRGSAVAAAIFYAVENGAQVINMSLGSEQVSTLELRAIHYAYEKGIAVVIAAGNNGVNTEDFGMAGAADTITVAATDQQDQRAGFSNWGPGIDIAAPGIDVLSLRSQLTDFADTMGVGDYQAGAWFVGNDEQFYRASGTSFAAPIVAGVVSLMLAKDAKLTPLQIKRVLQNSARDIETPGIDQYTGYGLLDAYAALTASPDFFVDAEIIGVEVVQVEGKSVLRVVGVAAADKFKKAWIEIGAGDTPDKWVKVSATLKKAIRNGVLADLELENFRSAQQWTLRLTTEHRGGRVREHRFLLNLG